MEPVKTPVDLSRLVIERKRLSRATSIGRRVFASQLEHVLLDLRTHKINSLFCQVEDELHLSVPEGLADPTAVRAKEVVGHVRVEVDVVLLADEVPLLGS